VPIARSILRGHGQVAVFEARLDMPIDDPREHVERHGLREIVPRLRGDAVDDEDTQGLFSQGARKLIPCGSKVGLFACRPKRTRAHRSAP
jgi:hypothetical protein